MRKLTHALLSDFYTANATGAKTLDVGSAGERNKLLFPNSTTVDIDASNKPDVVADAHQLPFEDNSFECIVCKEVLEHVKRPDIVLSEFRRVLKPGGKLILSTRFLFPIHEAPNDHWRFTKYCLEELLRDWSRPSVVPESDPITALIILIDRCIYQSDFRFNKISKGVLLLFTFLLVPFKFLLLRQYGDVTKTTRVDTAFTSGYHVIAYK